MCSTIPILRQSVWVLLECLPPGLDYSQLHSALSCLDGVQSVHALHVWALTPGHYVATAHLAVGKCKMHVMSTSSKSLLNLFSPFVKNKLTNSVVRIFFKSD